ncbi:tyrosine-type recombinase/integrase [Solihabitans fulvus]|uniref:Tyrosine-type recombinase/integrase n=1 Tax=Solihabitans fulvus TaxID=1892852 RepID=A0A5B2XPC9_9PSEU|nr:tyrosine-type recombinase/integrase [Solihabitans fulvus]KAA2265233.1 tyrosine-type recombinase/integrase [Solihabitans fulvus]
MARTAGRRPTRQRGNIEELPSGALRVRVYAGTDPVTKRRHNLVETVPAGPKAWEEAEQVRTRLLNQIDERRNPRTNATLNQLLDRYLTTERFTGEASTLRGYRRYAKNHIRPLIGGEKAGEIDGDILDSFYAELRRCRDHCDRRHRIDHRTAQKHTCDKRCAPHQCLPLAASTVRQIHFILSGAFKRAVRWRWTATNPISQAEPPAPPKPAPQPPSTDEAALLLTEAWKDPDWGTLVWLAMTTGARRAELCALRWRHVDLVEGVLTLHRSIGQDEDGKPKEKDTKDHQQRRVALDPETVAALTRHWQRCGTRAKVLGLVIGPDAFVFSLAPDNSAHLLPDTVTQRYDRMAQRLGLHTTIHKLRHYSATELIAAGVDVRTIAGRLGHSGGGTTTLRVYAAWVSESDQRASTALMNRIPALPALPADPREQSKVDPHSPYEKIAAAIRQRILDGELKVGDPAPSLKDIAAEHQVAAGTAHRAMALLKEWGLVEASRGRRAVVVSTEALPSREPTNSEPSQPVGILATTVTAPSGAVGVERKALELEIRRKGYVVAKLTAEADPEELGELRQLLVDGILRDGYDESRIAEYEMDVHYLGNPDLLMTFVASAR